MIHITWDEKRYGYWVMGEGFHFFAYFTSDGGVDENLEQEFIECDYVKREGESFVLHLQIPLKTISGIKGIQVVETQIINELRKYWDIS